MLKSSLMLQSTTNPALKVISGGTVTSPCGFLGGAVHAGLKTRDKNTLDLGILCSPLPCPAAGVFTSNRIKAAPIALCQKCLSRKCAQAVVVNSGCANACTGEQGQADAAEMVHLAAQRLGISPEDVLVASTGVIGTPLPMKLIRSGIDNITLSRHGGHELAWAITTTDTFTKEIAVTLRLEESEITLGGVAKGAGMIHPELATLLCFLTTDAKVDPDLLQQALQKAIDISFNMVSIDGDTSPNDTVLLLANGLAHNEAIHSGSRSGEKFEQALIEVCLSLAKQIARDGEGATKLIEVTVEGALTWGDARVAARSIAASSLVKAAVHGSDPNWGRVISALGQSKAEIDPSRIDLYLGELCLFSGGHPLLFDKAKAILILSQDEVPIKLCLNLGPEKATAWGCDLSEEYVTINSTYTT